MKLWKKWLAMALAVAVVTPSQMMAPATAMTAEASDTIWLTDADLNDAVATAPESWGAVPNEEQLWYMKEGLAAFCHFGPNTYNNVEWGQSYGTRTPSDIFQLDNAFDADYIVRTIKEAGFSRLVLTCKHHDGLCLWNTETTDYSVANTDNADAYGGDILEALSDACTKYNVDMGCYLSPWDIHEDKYGCFGDVDLALPGGYVNSEYRDYNELYMDQIKEICTAVKTDENGNPLTDENGNPIYKYGNNNPNRRSDRFVEWWMDGAQGEGDLQAYDWNGIIGTIREYNPSCQIFGTGKAAKNSANPEVDRPLASTGGIHWIGNEAGYASETTWAKVNAGQDYEELRKSVAQGHAIEGDPNGDVWSVPEVDVKSLAGWFWRDSAGDNTVKSESDMAKIYFDSVGRGATLLLNLSPNKEGTVGEQQMAAFSTLGENIKETFDEDLTKAEGVTAKATSVWGNSKAYSASQVLDEIPEGEVYDETYWAPEEGQTSGSLEIDLGGLKTFDLVSLEEYIQKGQTIKSFTIEYKNAAGRWEEFATGTTISSLRLCRRSEVEGRAIRVTINDAYSTPMLVNVGVYKMAEGFEVPEENNGPVMPTNLSFKGIMDFTLTENNNGTWTKENNNTSAWSNANKGGVATFSFTGTQAWIMGTIDPNHGTMDVYIDNEKITSVNTHNTVRDMNALLYTTPELEYGEHTVKMVCTQNAIGLGGAYYQDGSGVFSLSHESMSMLYGGTAEIKILREGGSKGEVEVTYYTESSGAEQGVDYINLTDTVVFEEGETEKTILLTGLVNNRNVDGKDFFVTIGDVQKIVGEEKQPASMGETDYAHIRLYTVNPELLLENARNIDTEAYSQKRVEAFEEAIRVMELCAASDLATESALREAAQALLDAQNALSEPVAEDSEEPAVFTLPSLVGEEILLEAESFTLDASGAADANKYVRITQFTHEGKVHDEVNWFENGNKIKKTFYAPEAGTYTFTAQYRSGRSAGSPNAFVWSGTNVQNGELAVHGDGNANTYCTAALTIEVTQPGEGELIFTADGRGGPVIDSFTVTFADATKTEIEAESVSLNVEELQLTTEKQSALLIATVLPKDATNKAVTFESSAPDVIAVDNNGVVKALKSGEAVITVKTVVGEFTDTCKVTAELKSGDDNEGGNTPGGDEEHVHEFGAWTVKTAATCEAKGEEVRSCTVEGCGHAESRVIEKTAHKMDAGTITTEATCGAAGVKTFKCTNVGCTYTTTEAVPQLTTHTWDAGKVTTEPTTKAEGVKTYTCSVCNTTKTEAIPALKEETKPSDKEEVKVELPKKNSKVKVNGVTYKVTKPAKKNGTVSFAKPKTNATNVVIPATVKIKGVIYKVTAVEANAFKNNKKVKNITVGTNVTKIGATAFSNCKNLKKITFKTTKLVKKSIAKTAFRAIKKSTKIVVNKKKVNAYKTMFRSKGLSKTVKVTK